MTEEALEQLEKRIMELESRLRECQSELHRFKEVSLQYRDHIRGIYADATHLKKSIDESFDEFGKSFP